jgi:hypothetical protein
MRLQACTQALENKVRYPTDRQTGIKYSRYKVAYHDFCLGSRSRDCGGARRQESPRNDRLNPSSAKKEKNADEEKNAARNVGKGENNEFMFVHWREPLHAYCCKDWKSCFEVAKKNGWKDFS